MSRNRETRLVRQLRLALEQVVLELPDLDRVLCRGYGEDDHPGDIRVWVQRPRRRIPRGSDGLVRFGLVHELPVGMAIDADSLSPESVPRYGDLARPCVRVLLVRDEEWWSSNFAEVWDDHVWLPEENPAAGLDHVAAWLAGEEYHAAWRARQEEERRRERRAWMTAQGLDPDAPPSMVRRGRGTRVATGG